MSLLALASHNIAHGYECKVVDERVHTLKDDDIMAAKIIGISTMSGPALKCSIKTAERIKKINPDAVLIWGGAHPSAFTEQTARSSLVDVSVKGEGEKTFLELCKRILEGKDYSDIPGTTLMKDDKLISNPMAAPMDMNEMAFPRYELFDLKEYADYEEGLSYETSRGCPFRCTFCYVEYFHDRKWRGKNVETVINELKRIKKEVGVKKVYFLEDNFFGNKKRSLEICSQMVSSNIDLDWTTTARADFLSGCSDEEMELLSKAGCKILIVGAESGSDRVLGIIKKDITAAQIKSAVTKCVANNIMPAVSFIIGFPFEEDSDVNQSIDLYDELMSIGGKKVEINGLFLFTPYAGTAIFDTAVEYGYKPPQTLEEWSKWVFNDPNNNPWLTGRARKKKKIMTYVTRFKFLYHRFEYYSDDLKKQKLKTPLMRLGYFIFAKLFSINANWRWKHKFFSFAYEWVLCNKLTYMLFKTR
jgi:radical SAM superfamily enzyme YgiQ (UPF0313 family)